jgi:hypothetical protein
MVVTTAETTVVQMGHYLVECLVERKVGKTVAWMVLMSVVLWVVEMEIQTGRQMGLLKAEN